MRRFVVLVSIILLSSGADIAVTKCRQRCSNPEQGSNCTSDCTPTPRAVRRTPTPDPRGGTSCSSYGFANTKGCGCVRICNDVCEVKHYDATAGAVYSIDHLEARFSAATENYPQRLTFVFSWEIWRNLSGRTSRVNNLPLGVIIQENEDGSMGPETNLIVNTNPCTLTVSDVNGKINWNFKKTYTFYFQIMSQDSKSKYTFWREKVTTGACEDYYRTPEEQRKYCGKKFFPAPAPPRNVTTCVYLRHDHVMDVLLKWQPSNSVAPIISSTVVLSYLKNQKNFVLIDLPPYSIPNNGTSYLLKSLNTAYLRYCASVSSSIDSHLAAPDNAESIASTFCFSNSSLKLCELPKKVFVHVSEPSGDDSYYVEVIGGPVVGFVIIVLGLVISWNICRLRSRPQRYRALEIGNERGHTSSSDNTMVHQCTPPRVLVVYSEETGTAGRGIVYKLCDVGIDATSNQFETEESHPNIVDWVNRKLEEAKFILFLFDEHMNREWGERRRSETSMIIMHVEGLYNSDQNAASQKCLVLIKSKEDVKYIPTMMARHKAFEWKDFGDEVNEELICVILGEPGQFDRPPVARTDRSQCISRGCINV